MNYDLEERVSKFGEEILMFCKSIKLDDFTRSLVKQLIRSGTSIGANYMEANQASSKRDFRNKIRISQKESNETKHWLRMIATVSEANKDMCRRHWQEAHELTLIFAKISRKTK